MQNKKGQIFNKIQVKRPGRNSFDLSHSVKLSAIAGTLIPTCVVEAVPGDKFNVSCQSIARMAPTLAPLMSNVDVFFHWWFVPNRIIWDSWELYITGGSDQGAFPGTGAALPFVNINGTAIGGGNYTKLMDYLGIPPPPASAQQAVSALPFAAYNKIYEDYYRDENLIAADPFAWQLNDGDCTTQFETSTGFDLKIRAWQHDYFTSALPWPQKGVQVSLPLGLVVLDPATTSEGVFRQDAAGHALLADGTSSTLAGSLQSSASPGVNSVYDPQGTLTVGPTTINDLRRAIRLQEWFEKNARGGTRYSEYIWAHWGIKPSDARLQRAEYITGSKSPLVISEVLNTTGTDAAPQGNMAGHGVSVTGGYGGSYFCEEHGWIMCIMSILPRAVYSQGIEKHFLKTGDNFQYFTPEFANIGEQEIENMELFAFDSGSTGVFGYTPRYAEYKYVNDRVAGDFRTTLDFWVWQRKFASLPTLSQEFIECVPNQDIFPVEIEDDYFYVNIINKVRASRLMPVYGTPTF